MVYDADDQQVLRKIGAGYHEMDSVVFDEQHNFVMAANKPGACSIMKHNLKGDHVSLQHYILGNTMTNLKQCIFGES